MKHYDNQNHYWDDIAGDKEFTTPLQMELFTAYVDLEARVLDHGCGYGRILGELKHAGYKHLYGTDSSAKMIERAAEEHSQVGFKVGDGKRIPFAKESFDAVLLVAVLTSVISDEAQEGMIAEAQRVLKSGGFLYINDFLLNQDERNIRRYRQFQDRYGQYGVFELPEGAVCRHHSSAWIHQLLRGFDTICYEETVYNTMNGNRSNGFYYLGKKPAQS